MASDTIVNAKACDYRRLPHDDGVEHADGEHVRPYESSFNRRPALISFAWILSFALAILAGACFASLHPLHIFHRSAEPHIITCGHTAAEAAAAGCVIEPLTWAWMHPKCIYPEVAEQHIAPFSDLEWFSDSNYSQPATEEQALQGSIEHLWTHDGRYHLHHCLFLIRKLAYAVENRVEWLDNKSSNGAHIGHCVGYLTRVGETGVLPVPNWIHLTTYDCQKAPWAS